MLLHALLHAERQALAFCRHRDTRLGGVLGIPICKTVLAVFQWLDLQEFDAVTFRVSFQRLGERRFISAADLVVLVGIGLLMMVIAIQRASAPLVPAGQLASRKPQQEVLTQPPLRPTLGACRA